MRIAGIVAEYNPFHRGHAWQIAQLRALGYDCIVCVCSPSVVQRGTASIFPTYVRTKAALVGGADVVISLPAPYATLSAQGFADSAVHLLCALGICDVIAFGAENANVEAFTHLATLLTSEAFDTALQAQLAMGSAYAKARADALHTLAPEDAALLDAPNNNLGIAYCIALQALAKAAPTRTLPCPFALTRKGAQHDAPLAKDATAYASATAVRTLAYANDVEAIAPFVPPACMDVYRTAERDGLKTDLRTFEIAVLSRLRALTEHDLQSVRGTVEGLDNRLALAIQTQGTLEGVYDSMKTKRYAHARVRRLVLDAVVGFGDDLPKAPPYLHVLGATRQGFRALKLAKERASLPMSDSLRALANTSPQAQQVADAHARAEDLVALCLHTPQPCGSVYTTKFCVAEHE